jgi:hypothetical protein
MKKTRKIIKGISLKLDALFLRNLTLIMATIFIWRGTWNLADHYFFPHSFLTSNISMIFLGLLLLFIFDSEIEETEQEIEEMENFEGNGKHNHKHLLNDHI